jgi:NADH-quinone oxidoreductase subunit M
MLAILIFLPLLAAISIFAAPKKAYQVALGFSIIEFLFSLILYFGFDSSAGTQISIDAEWIGSLGIHFKVGVDGLSLLLVMLTTFLTPLIILSSKNREYK